MRLVIVCTIVLFVSALFAIPVLKARREQSRLIERVRELIVKINAEIYDYERMKRPSSVQEATAQRESVRTRLIEPIRELKSLANKTSGTTSDQSINDEANHLIGRVELFLFERITTVELQDLERKLASGGVSRVQAITILGTKILPPYQVALKDYLLYLKSQKGLDAKAIESASASFRKVLAGYEGRLITLEIQENMSAFKKVATKIYKGGTLPEAKVVLKQITALHAEVSKRLLLPNRIFASEMISYEDSYSILSFDLRERALERSYVNLEKTMKSKRPNYKAAQAYVLNSLLPAVRYVPFTQRMPATSGFTVQSVLSKLAHDKEACLLSMGEALKAHDIKAWAKLSMTWKKLDASPESSSLELNASKMRERLIGRG